MQGYVDEAARATNRSEYLTAPAYGTAVHKRVQKCIGDLDDNRLIAERSYFKQRDAADSANKPRYSLRDTVRIDIYEDVGDGTICIHDLKTGRAGLDWLRALALVKAE